MFMTMSQLARELGVDRRQVWAWHQRRNRNGFPEIARMVEVPYRRTPVPAWRLAEVKIWMEDYDPLAWPKRPRKNLR